VTHRFNFLQHDISILNRKISNQNATNCSVFLHWFGPGGSENACIFRIRKKRVATRLKICLIFRSQWKMDRRIKLSAYISVVILAALILIIVIVVLTLFFQREMNIREPEE
jgi:hypothetical protein